MKIERIENTYIVDYQSRAGDRRLAFTPNQFGQFLFEHLDHSVLLEIAPSVMQRQQELDERAEVAAMEQARREAWYEQSAQFVAKTRKLRYQDDANMERESRSRCTMLHALDLHRIEAFKVRYGEHETFTTRQDIFDRVREHGHETLNAELRALRFGCRPNPSQREPNEQQAIYYAMRAN